MDPKLAEELAIAALRGWFGDPNGFNRDTRNRQRAVKAIAAILQQLPKKEGSES